MGSSPSSTLVTLTLTPTTTTPCGNASTSRMVPSFQVTTPPMVLSLLPQKQQKAIATPDQEEWLPNPVDPCLPQGD